MTNPVVSTSALLYPNIARDQHGPYEDSSGYLYIAGLNTEAGGSNTVRVYRSTDAGQTWSLYASNSSAYSVAGQFDSVYDASANKIYTLTLYANYLQIYVCDLGAGTCTRFDSGNSPQVRVGGNISLVRRSTGQLVAFYDANSQTSSMGNSYFNVGYATVASGGGAWSAETVVGAGSSTGDMHVCDCCRGASDRVHFLMQQGTANLQHRSVSSAAALDTTVTVIASANDLYARIFSDGTRLFVEPGYSGPWRRATSGATPTFTADTYSGPNSVNEIGWMYDAATTTMTVVNVGGNGLLYYSKNLGATQDWNDSGSLGTLDFDSLYGQQSSAQLGCVGNTGGYPSGWATAFTPDHSFSFAEVVLQASRSTTATMAGDIVLELCADDADGTVPGTTLATTSSPCSTFTDTSTHFWPFTFGSPYTVSGGTTYWIKATRSATGDNYFLYWNVWSQSSGNSAYQAASGPPWTNIARGFIWSSPAPIAGNSNYGSDGAGVSAGLMGIYWDGAATRLYLKQNPQAYTKAGRAISDFDGRGKKYGIEYGHGITEFKGGGARVGGSRQLPTSGRGIIEFGGLGKSAIAGWITVTGGTNHSVFGSSGDTDIQIATTLGAVQKNDLIVVIGRRVANDGQEGFDKCVDTLGTQYKRAGSDNFWGEGLSYCGVTTFYGIAPAAGTPTVTLKYANYPVGTPPFTPEHSIDRGMAVQVFRPKKGIPVLDTGASVSPATTTDAANNAHGAHVYTNYGGDLIVATVGSITGGGSGFQAGTGYTLDRLLNDGSMYWPIAIEHKTQGTPGDVSGDFTFNGGGTASGGYSYFNVTLAFTAYDSTQYFSKTGRGVMGGRSRRRFERYLWDSFADLSAWTVSNTGSGSAASDGQLTLTCPSSSDVAMIEAPAALSIGTDGGSCEIDLVSLDVGGTLRLGWAANPDSSRPAEVALTHDSTGTGWHVSATVGTATQTINIGSLPPKLRLITDGGYTVPQYSWDRDGIIWQDVETPYLVPESLSSLKPYVRLTSAGGGSVSAVVRDFGRPQSLSSDRFGTSYYVDGSALAISGDGAVIAVGASGYPAGGGSGRVYVYSGPGYANELVIPKDPELGSSNAFGSVVVLSGDGKVLAIGADDASSKHVYVYSGENFGTLTKVSWSAASNYAPTALALSDDGSVLVIGHGTTQSGVSGTVEVKYGPNWGSTITLSASDGAALNGFGKSVAVSSDGSIVAAGAPQAVAAGLTDAGKAYVYSGASWATETILQEPTPIATNLFGDSVALDAAGNTLVVGVGRTDNPNVNSSPPLCQAYVFTGAAWGTATTLPRRHKTQFDQYGAAVAITRDASIIVVGAPGFRGTPTTGGQVAGSWLASPDNAVVWDSDRIHATYFQTGAVFSYTGPDWAVETLHNYADIPYINDQITRTGDDDGVGKAVAIADDGTLVAAAVGPTGGAYGRIHSDHTSGWVMLDHPPGTNGLSGHGSAVLIPGGHTGTGVAVFTGHGPDEFTATETGRGVAQFRVNGPDVVIYSETGTAVSAFSGGGTDLDTTIETGIAVLPLAGGGPDITTTIETGTAISEFTGGAPKIGTLSRTGTAAADFTGHGPNQISVSRFGRGISERSGGGLKAGGKEKKNVGVAVFTGHGTDADTRNRAGRASPDFSGHGADACVFVETGRAVAAFGAAGPKEVAKAKTGVAISDFDGFGSKEWIRASIEYTKQGTGVAEFSGFGSEVFVVEKTGLGIIEFSVAGYHSAVYIKTGLGDIGP